MEAIVRQPPSSAQPAIRRVVTLPPRHVSNGASVSVVPPSVTALRGPTSATPVAALAAGTRSPTGVSVVPPQFFCSTTSAAGVAAGSLASSATLGPAKISAVAPVGGGDAAAGPLVRQRTARSRTEVNTHQLRAISLEYTQTELTKATQNWDARMKLGSGCHGAVYRGELKDGTEVAIKHIELSPKAVSDDSGFEDEVLMLSKFRHPNLVTLLGWAQQGCSRYLVYEFLAGGDVFQRLHRRARGSGVAGEGFMWHDRLSVMLDAATGLSHMHNSTPKAFHRDIKSANVLLDRHGTAKMADFGLSCCASGAAGAHDHVTDKTVSGTPGYKCPIYELTMRFTEASEVYSFGMVMLEVVTGLHPSKNDTQRPGAILYPIAETLAPTQPGALERCARHADPAAHWPGALPNSMAELALRCCHASDERQRPIFVDIVRALRALVERFPRGGASGEAPALALAAGVRGATPAAAGPQPQVAGGSVAGARATAATAAPADSLPLGGAVNVAKVGAGATPERSRPATRVAAGTPSVVKAARPSEVSARSSPQMSPATPPPQLQRPSAVEAALNLSMTAELSASRMTDAPLRPPTVLLDSPPQPAGGVSASSSAAAPALLRPVAVASPPGAGNGEVRFQLIVTYARENDVAAIPSHLQVLSVAAAPGQSGTTLIAPIGRLHQPDFFEAWLPDMSLRSCVSRNAFEVSWSTTSDEAWIMSLGTHPLSVDGKVLPKNTQGAISPGSEIRLTFENKVLLCLKFVPAPAVAVARGAADAASASIPPSPAVVAYAAPVAAPAASAHDPAARSASTLEPQAARQLIAPALGGGDGAEEERSKGLEPARILKTLEAARAERRSMRASPGSEGAAELKAAFVPVECDLPLSAPEARRSSPTAAAASSSARQASAQCPKLSPWRLACLHAEGLSADGASQGTPAEMAAIELEEGLSHIGRHHQARHFAMWLKDPGVRFGSLSATHLQSEVSDMGVRITNLSASGVVYIGRELLKSGEARELRAGELLSFSRTSGTVDEAFLVLQLLRQTDGGPVRCFSPLARPARPSTPSPSPPPRRSPSPSSAAVVHPGAAVAAAMPSLASSPGVRIGSGVEGAAVSEARGARPRVAASAPAGAAPAGVKPLVVLELMGDGAQELLPLEQRRIGPVPLGDEPLLVGRRFQPELHDDGIKPDFQKLVSNDQFCIAYSGGEFWLLVLAQRSSVWHVRPSALTCDELRRDTLVPLLPKDEICLGPGLYWRFDRVEDAGGVRGLGSSKYGVVPVNVGR